MKKYRKARYRYKKRHKRNKYNSNTEYIINLLIRNFFLALLILSIVNFLTSRNTNVIDNIDYYNIEQIQEFNISYDAIEYIKKESSDDIDFYELFTQNMIYNDFDLTNWENSNFISEKNYTNKNDFNDLIKIYETLLSEIKTLPITKEIFCDTNEITYVDSWLASRSYGGDRPHYGTDIMHVANIRGQIPIISMTDGIIEQIGWLEKGGYRIGIRTESGAYFYYAHLESYGDNLEKGMHISAGDLLGYMGDSGYGEEGTIGMFDVHLHLGISLPIEDNNETWFNPYWILKYLEELDY